MTWQGPRIDLEFEYNFDFFANALFWESGENLDLQRPTVAKRP